MSTHELIQYQDQTIDRMEGLLVTQLDKLQEALQVSTADNFQLKQQQLIQQDNLQKDSGIDIPRVVP